MGWRIVNRTPQLLIVPLNSGKAVHLAPNETSPLLEHAEINGNAKVEKLLASKSITVVEEKMRKAAAAAQNEARRITTQPVEVAHKIEREQESEHEQEGEQEPKKK
jgi:hypothetical protein